MGQVRGPWKVLLLGIITLGIYTLVWQYSTFKEMKEYSGQGIGGGLAIVLAIFTLGIPNLFLMPAEIGNLYASEGQTKPVSGPTGFWCLLPYIGGLVWLWKVTGRLNDFWVAHGAQAA